MRTKEIEMSNTGLSQILQTIGRLDVALLDVEPGGAKEYLRACEEWERLGLGEPDFDGSFRPERLFGRLVYSLKESACALRYQSGGGDALVFLRGVVDLIRLRKPANRQTWLLSFQPMNELREVFLEEIAPAREGVVWVQPRGGEASELNLADTQPGSPERLQALNAQLAQFYPRYSTKGGDGV